MQDIIKISILIFMLFIPNFVLADDLEVKLSVCKMERMLIEMAINLRKSDVPFNEAVLFFKKQLNDFDE